MLIYDQIPSLPVSYTHTQTLMTEQTGRTEKS